MSAGALSCGTDAVRPRRLLGGIGFRLFEVVREETRSLTCLVDVRLLKKSRMQYKRTKLLPSSLRSLPSSWRWRQLAANGRRRQQLAKTLRRPTCGLFIKLRPFVPAHY